MSEAAIKQIVALRLAHAAAGAWDLLRAEVNQIGNLRETTQAYMGAVALLFSYVLYTSEVMGQHVYSPEEVAEVFAAFEEDVRRSIDHHRQTRPEQDPAVPPAKGVKNEVH